MREQRRAVIAVEGQQRVPQRAGILREPLYPSLVPLVDRLGQGGVVEAGRLNIKAGALGGDLQARARPVTVERREAQRVEHGDERHVEIVGERLAQRQRAIRRQLRDEAIGQRLDAVFLGAGSSLSAGVPPTVITVRGAAGRSTPSPGSYQAR